MATYQTRIVDYLIANGVAYEAGGDLNILAEANDKINATDKALLDGYKHDVKKDDKSLAVIFIGLIVVLGVVIVRLIQDLHNTRTFLICIVVALLLVITMHNVWKDRFRTQHLLKVCHYLTRKTD